jgi:plastocyanin
MQRLYLLLAMSFVSVVPVFGADLSGNVLVSGAPTQHAVVWLDVANAPPLAQTKKITLDQRNVSFSPHVLVVRVGTTVDFPNNDKVFHNVFSFRDGKKFDLGMYPIGTSKKILFDKPGLARLFCNIHPSMAAYVMAVDTPYYAVSDQRGTFAIPGVPAGTYTYYAWRPGGKTLTGSVTVDASRPLEIRWP